MKNLTWVFLIITTFLSSFLLVSCDTETIGSKPPDTSLEATPNKLNSMPPSPEMTKTIPSKLASPVTVTATGPISTSPPLGLYLTLSKWPRLNEPVYLICNVYALRDITNCAAQITLPPGVGLISGNPYWKGDLKNLANGFTFTIQIIFKEPGNQIIEGTAFHIVDNSRNDLIFQDNLELNFTTEGGAVGSIPERRVNKYGVIKTNLEISHAPKLKETAILSVNFLSPIDVPKNSNEGLIARLVFSKQNYTLLDGSTAIPVDIQANKPMNFTAKVTFNETGYWYIGAAVTELITHGSPAGIVYSSPSDTLFLKIGVDQSTFESLPILPPVNK
jgi:hypothetical protein